ncbi:MAG: c-type cytochrome biogenesis protein CcmI [Hyphomicrobiaceae bacterium]|nr:c-type cytochrome biogenesis protein CcmI [Hyphomicrobiaceae bacterium]
MLWIGFALLTAVIVAVLVRPLLRPADAATNTREADIAVYRDQLKAVDADREQGLVGASEADAARAELARRLLRAADQSNNPKIAATHPAALGRTMTVVAGVLIPVVAIGIYLFVGSPNLPDNPFAPRVAEKNNAGRSMNDLIGLVEKRLEAHPDDGDGWAVIAPVYMKLQRFDDAAKAYAKVMRLKGETTDRLAGFAEAVVMANNGLIVPAARKAYERLRVLSPDSLEARFWLALAKGQDGNVADGLSDLEAMLKDAPPNAPWRSLVEQKAAEMRVSLGNGKNVAGTSTRVAGAGADSNGGATNEVRPQMPRASGGVKQAPGPTAQDVAAASDMTSEQRGAFIEQMVGRLAERLEKDGNDLDGWKRLVKAYMVMGRKQDAVGAMTKAKQAFAGDKAAVESLDAFAKDLGVGS